MNSSKEPGFQSSILAPPPMALTGPDKSVITYSVLPSGHSQIPIMVFRSKHFN
ncbi:MAG TPA: hypothetical protein VD815_04600 [Candidatus Saccharimonadales bacterium]|nr:hypothetical protein [Candidatus Saccharimonadales bacterium]